MLFDWEARSRKPLNYRDRMSQQQSQTFAKQRSKAVQFVRNNLIKAQQAYEKQANRRRKLIDWTVNDYVYVRKGTWTTDRPHDGLDNPYLGPYKVLSNPYSNVYEVDLPPSIKAHRFLNISRLIKARNNPVPD
jgi:hypothetical protein